MKGILKRWIALSLTFMLMCAAIPVQAQENGLDMQAETQTMESKIEQRLNFVYIESPYLETPKTQKMVVSWGDGTEEIESITANLTSESETEEWEATQHSGNLYLFEKAFSENQNGTYEVAELNVKTADASQTFSLADLGIEAEFGVNETYDGIEELKPLDAQETQELETSVVMIDQNGETEVQDGISEALREVSREMEGPSAKMRAASVDSRASEIVVALDPGHDSTHAGAAANGLREEVLTLKIANYCKAELEQYAGVRVYMTRTGAACPYPKDEEGVDNGSGGDIDMRVKAAAKQGARIFVSFHLNSSMAPNAQGAEVIYPNSSWRPQVGADGKALATAIWDELGKLGLTKRPIYSKDTTLDERYPDGSISDYFSVQISCKEQNIPGIIVEHAFISNSSDANNFLKTEAGLKKLGVADATGIAKFLELEKENNKDGWVTEGGYKYYYKDGKKWTGWASFGTKKYYFDSLGRMVTGWRTISGAKYYFVAEGYMHTGWASFGTKKYYFDSQGRMVTGWCTISGAKYYFMTEGYMHTGWASFGTKKYYFDSLGRMVTGWRTISGAKYYFVAEGYMHTGWGSFGTKKYYFDSQGRMVTGWCTISGAKYYFMTEGYMHTGWASFGTQRYYFNSQGKMVTGTQTIDGKTYYFSSEGVLQSTPVKEGWVTEGGYKYYYKDGKKWTGWASFGTKKYYFDSLGRMVTGWRTISGAKYYFVAEGYMHTGWGSFGTKKYYFDSQGRMVTGWCTISGAKYYFMTEGYMHTGWASFGTQRYYFNSQGKMVTGTQTIDGKTYYFSSEGVLQSTPVKEGWVTEGGYKYYYKDGKKWTGWASFGTKKYYFDSLGRMVTGWRTISGAKYYFVAEGYMHTGWGSFGTKKYYFDSQGRMVTGWCTISGAKYYFMTEGYMHTGWASFGTQRYYFNSQGKMVTGTQTIDGKIYYFSSEGVLQSTPVKEGWVTEGGYKYYYKDGKKWTGWASFGKEKYYFDSQGRMVTGWRTIGGVKYYFDVFGVLRNYSDAYYTIEGQTQTTVSQMVKFYQTSGKRYPSTALGKGGASTIQSFCQLYYEEAAKEGIRAEVAFAQAMEETGWLQYGGDVKIEQFNFAGLGATGGGVRGESFKDVRTGIRAQIQHLKAYGSTKPLNGVCVDNRFKYVKRGCALYVEVLGIPDNPEGLGWAAKKGYGYDIRDMIDAMLGL